MDLRESLVDWHRGFLALCFCFGPIIYPAVLTAQDFEASRHQAVEGVITSFQSPSSIVVEGEDEIRLWGLKIVKEASAKEILVGRSTLCIIVFFEDGIPVADCKLRPNGQQVQGYHRSNDLDLFTWFFQMGIAQKVCSAKSRKLNIVDHRNYGYSSIWGYNCDPALLPTKIPATED